MKYDLTIYESLEAFREREDRYSTGWIDLYGLTKEEANILFNICMAHGTVITVIGHEEAE